MGVGKRSGIPHLTPALSRPPMAHPGAEREYSLRVFPHRAALFEEGVDALGGVLRQHVLRHDLGGVSICVGEIELGLAVEGLLAESRR